jgi:hypothetical protein
VQAAQRQVEDPPRPHVRRLGVHHVADVEDLDRLAALPAKIATALMR